jgi:hypothetical protein
LKKHQRLLGLFFGALTCSSAAWAIPLREVNESASLSAEKLQDGVSVRLSPPEAKRVIEVRAKQVIFALRGKDMTKLSTFVHPEKGVRFSPYGYVTPEEDLVFKRKLVSGLWMSKRRYKWGSYDGTGDPIRLTFRSYYRRFIYDHDYSQVKQIGYNAEIMGRGNTRNNIYDTYPQGVVVEYHFPGVNPKYGGADWASLWLVFEKKDREWYLVAIVHDEWTI